MGLPAALAETADETTTPYRHLVVASCVLHKTLRDFGYFRCRRTCELLSDLLEVEHGIDVSGETIRRGLRKLGFVWRRPRPVLVLDPFEIWDRVERRMPSKDA